MSPSAESPAELVAEGTALVRRVQEGAPDAAALAEVQEYVLRADGELAAQGDTADGVGLELAQVTAFAQLTEINLLINLDRLDDASVAADRLLQMFRGRPAGESLPGFGTMLLDVVFWLLARERDEDALRICDALIERLSGGGRGEQIVAAGARFYAAQIQGRLGRLEESRLNIQALAEVGEPALPALNRIAAQFGEAEANPAWHVQIVATTVTVLWQLGRLSRAFQPTKLPDLQRMMVELERELATE